MADITYKVKRGIITKQVMFILIFSSCLKL